MALEIPVRCRFSYELARQSGLSSIGRTKRQIGRRGRVPCNLSDVMTWRRIVPPDNDSGRGEWTWALVPAAVLIAVVVVPLYWLRTMFVGTDAVLAFVGVLVTAAVSMIGFLVTRQSNQRLQEENRRAEQRLRQEHDDEQRRLKLDAAMQAGALFAPFGDRPANPASVASGLLALTKLDHADLAVALLVDLWSDDKESVSTETAVLVIDTALRSGQPKAQLVAAELLCRNATRLSACQSLHWPSVIDGCWDPGFGPKTKLLLLDALILMTVAEQANENSLRSVAVRLYGAWQGDPDERVKSCVGTLIGALITELTKLGYSDFLQGNKKVMLDELKAAADTATANPDGFLDRLVEDRSRRLQEWAATCDRIDLGKGSLATATANPIPAASAGP